MNVGAPDRSNDASVFNCSTLVEIIQNKIYCKDYFRWTAVKVQTHLVTDSAFCLSRALIKP